MKQNVQTIPGAYFPNIPNSPQISLDSLGTNVKSRFPIHTLLVSQSLALLFVTLVFYAANKQLRVTVEIQRAQIEELNTRLSFVRQKDEWVIPLVPQWREQEIKDAFERGLVIIFENEAEKIHHKRMLKFLNRE